MWRPCWHLCLNHRVLCLEAAWDDLWMEKKTVWLGGLIQEWGVWGSSLTDLNAYPFPSSLCSHWLRNASCWSGKMEASGLFNDVTVSDGDDGAFYWTCAKCQDSAHFSCIIRSCLHNDPMRKRFLFHLKMRKQTLWGPNQLTPRGPGGKGRSAFKQTEFDSRTGVPSHGGSLFCESEHFGAQSCLCPVPG